MSKAVQSNTQVGDLQQVAGVDLTGMEGRLVKLEAVAGKAAVVLPDGDTDLVPFVVLEGAAAEVNAAVRPLEPGRNIRLVLAGTCEPGDVLVLADGTVEADRGKVRVLPEDAGSYRQVAIAEESGVEGSWVLARPVAAVVITIDGDLGV